jgi:hypothetical protein
MKEDLPEIRNDMHLAVGQQAENNFRSDFEFPLNLPENLKALDELSRNFYWSWNPAGTELFRNLDPDLWDACEQNPRVLLRRISRLRLWQRSAEG